MNRNIKLLIVFFIAIFLTNNIHAQLASESKRIQVTQVKQTKIKNSSDSVNVTAAPIRLASDQPANFPTRNNSIITKQNLIIKDKNKRVRLASDVD